MGADVTVPEADDSITVPGVTQFEGELMSFSEPTILTAVAIADLPVDIAALLRTGVASLGFDIDEVDAVEYADGRIVKVTVIVT